MDSCNRRLTIDFQSIGNIEIFFILIIFVCLKSPGSSSLTRTFDISSQFGPDFLFKFLETKKNISLPECLDHVCQEDNVEEYSKEDGDTKEPRMT